MILGGDLLMEFIPFVLIEGMLIVIAMRLLILARNTKGLPEKLIGWFFVSLTLMIAFRVVSMLDLIQKMGWREVAFALGNISFCVGVVILYVFTWRVFRPGIAWARWLVVVGSAATVVLYGFRIWKGEEEQALKLVLSAVRMVPFFWAFIETTRYYRLMRRRRLIGLGDPVVANRFLLWAIWTGAVALLPMFSLVARSMLFAAGVGDPWSQSLDVQNTGTDGWIRGMEAMLAIGALAAIASLWLSFFPPAAYLRMLRNRFEREVA